MTNHNMQRRSPGNNYTNPGIYHITITISDRKSQSLGRVVGCLQYPDGHPDAPQRKTIDTLVTLPALKGYLVKEHALAENDTTTWEILKNRLMIDSMHVTCDSYGSLSLLSKRMLPVVCHRSDKKLFAQQKIALVILMSPDTQLLSLQEVSIP